LNLLPSAATSKGQHFEQIAERWLQARGLQPVTRNYRCRGGEIDLIMRQGDTLVFVEVRYRANATHGGAASSVTRRKQHKIVLAARHYFKQHAINEANQACRFDVIAFEGDQPDWIQNAF
jgi:putative endonuclease